MSTRSPVKEPEQTVIPNATEVNSPIHRAFMSTGVNGWLRNITVGNQSGESLTDMLSEERDRNATSVVNRAESRRPDSHVRGTATILPSARTTSLHTLPRDGSSTIAPEGVVQPPRKKRLRISAIIPFILSATAFSFSLVLILAGSNGGYLTNVNIISFNTTNLGTGIISFAPASSSSTTTTSSTRTSSSLGKRETVAPFVITTIITTTTALAHEKRQTFNPLDPFGLIPVLSSAIVSRASVDSSVLASAGSAVASQFPLPSVSIPGLALPTGLTSSNGTGISTGLLGALGSLIKGGLSSLLSSLATGLGASGITQAISDALNEEIADFIGRIISSAGVADYYSLYILSTCQGSSSSNITSCSPFSSAANSISNVSSEIPSSVVVLGTNVSSPALGEVTDAIASLGPTVTALEKFLLALMILSMINSGLAIILAFLGIFLPHNRKILYGNLSLASIGILSRGIDAILATSISAALAFVTNKFGNALGVSATSGGTFITLIWLGFLFQGLSSTYWYGVWFVEFRQTSFKIRRREEVQMGDYKGVFREIRSDFSLPKQESMTEKRSSLNEGPIVEAGRRGSL